MALASSAIHRVFAIGILVGFVLTAFAGQAAAPPTECKTYPTIRNAAAGYDAGSVMTIDYKAECRSGTVALRWPNDWTVKSWAVPKGSGTLTYRIPPYTFTGTWSALGTPGNIVSSTNVRPINLPVTGRMVQLGEDEVAVTSHKSSSALAYHDFHPPYTRAWSALSTSASRQDVGDVDGDGVDEVVTVSAWKDTTKYVRVTEVGPADRDPIGWPAWAFPYAGYTPEDVAVGDYDGDGREDIAILYYDAGGTLPNRHVGVWTAWGWNFWQPTYFFEIPDSAYTHRLAAGDLTGDGRDEVVWSTDWWYDPCPWCTDFWIGYKNFATGATDIDHVTDTTTPIVDLTTVKESMNTPAKIVTMVYGKVRFFYVDPATGKIANDPVRGATEYTVVPSGDSGPYRAISAGDQDGDGADEIFTLATSPSRRVYGRVYEYNLKTGSIDGWNVGRELYDGGGSYADIGVGDLNGDGMFVYPTGVVQDVDPDGVIIARVGTPPYPKDHVSDYGSGLFGMTESGGHSTGMSTTFTAGIGFTMSADPGIGVSADLTVMLTLSHTKTELESWTYSTETWVQSNPDFDTLMIEQTHYYSYEYRTWNRDINHDGLVNDKDVVWLDVNQQTLYQGVSVDWWNTRSPWKDYASWVELPVGKTDGWYEQGDPPSYPRGCPARTDVVWVPHAGGDCAWMAPTDATWGITYEESQEFESTIANSWEISVDGSIRAGLFGVEAGVAFTAGFGQEYFESTTTGEGFQIAVTAPALKHDEDYDVWKYRFVPYLSLVSMHPATDQRVLQQFVVLNYAVDPDFFGTGYDFPGAPGKPTWTPGDQNDGIYEIWWDPAPRGRGGGIKEYEVQEQKDGGAWQVIGYPTVPSFTPPYRVPGTYLYQTRAHDYEGNWGPLSPTSDSLIVPWDMRLTNNVYDSVTPSIATDSFGNYHIVWADTRDGNSEIYYKKVDPDWNVLVADTRLTTNSYDSVSPTIVVSPGATPTIAVVWSDNRDGNYEIYTKTRNPAMGWMPDVRLTTDDPDSKEPDVALDASGNFHYFWRDVYRLPPPFQETERIMYRRNGESPMTAYTMVGAPITDPHPDRLLSPRIAVGNSAVLHGVFSKGPSAGFESGTSYVYYIRWAVSSWGSPTPLGTDTAAPRRVSVDADAYGRVYAAWEKNDGDFNIHFRRSDDNGVTWSSPTKILGASGSDQIAPDIAVSANGHVYIAWADNAAGQYEIQYVVNTHYGDEFYWSDPSWLTNAEQDSLCPRIAISPMGGWKVGVVWQDYRDMNWEIYFTAKYI